MTGQHIAHNTDLARMQPFTDPKPSQNETNKHKNKLLLFLLRHTAGAKPRKTTYLT